MRKKIREQATVAQKGRRLASIGSSRRARSTAVYMPRFTRAPKVAQPSRH